MGSTLQLAKCAALSTSSQYFTEAPHLQRMKESETSQKVAPQQGPNPSVRDINVMLKYIEQIIYIYKLAVYQMCHNPDFDPFVKHFSS